MIRRITSPLVLAALLVSFSIGWSTRSAPPEGLAYPVNMTLDGTRLYVSDLVSGVHIFDVTDPAAPAKTLRIPLDGNRGTAVKGDIVFASEESDLLAIRVTGDAYEVIARLGSEYDGGGGEVHWNEVPPSGGGFACACATGGFVSSDTAPISSGGGSSYATFALIGDFLYRVDYTSLVVYDVSTPEAPREVSRQHVGWEIETLHPTDTHLFIGGMRGMHIFDRVNPGYPRRVGTMQHARACDPVVVSGSIAYVTLRGTAVCGQAPDELLCVDVQSPGSPRLIGQKPMTTPYGLAVDYPYLYVSNGESGYTLVDVARPTAPITVAAWPTWPTRDFIWAGSILYVLGADDLRVFDVTNPKTPVLKSTIEAGTS